MSWSAIRKGELVQAVQPRNLREALSKVTADLVIVDTAGQIDGLDTLEPMLCADLVLVPVRPSAFDIAATHRTLALLKANNKKGLVVLSSAPLRAPEIAMARQALAGATPIATTVIHDRRPFSRAIQTGRSVGEMDATSPAAIEVNLLLGEIL
jgi:chromosome partitioning protein